MREITYIVSLFFILSPYFAYADDSYLLTQVTEGIYYHQGIHQDATEENIGAIANVGFIIGNDCVAVIDSGGSYREGVLLNQAVRSKTDKPICYVINTHVHPDHILGNSAFKQDNPTYIGHEKLAAAMTARKEYFERVFSSILGSAYKGTEFIPPSTTVTVKHPLVLNLGNRELVVTAYKTAHTDHDITVYDKNSQTLWTGDLLFIERIPSIDGSINGWIEVSKQLQSKSVLHLIPGHGTAQDKDLNNSWQKQLNYLTTIRDGIRQVIYDFGTIEQATSSVGLSEKNQWQLFDHYHRRNITAAFVELEWE